MDRAPAEVARPTAEHQETRECGVRCLALPRGAILLGDRCAIAAASEVALHGTLDAPGDHKEREEHCRQVSARSRPLKPAREQPQQTRRGAARDADSTNRHRCHTADERAGDDPATPPELNAGEEAKGLVCVFDGIACWRGRVWFQGERLLTFPGRPRPAFVAKCSAARAQRFLRRQLRLATR
jgi:hypothetical protein